MNPVHIITPFFCQKGFNESTINYFLLTVRTLKLTAGYPFEWTIIDNNSSEEIIEIIKKEIEPLNYVTRIIYNDKNYGIATAMNQGIDLGPTDYILKLDADMSFYKRGWLEQLVWAADNIQKAGAFGVSVEKNSYPIFRYQGREYQDHVAHIGGACFLIPKRIFDKIGYWNEEYDPYGGADGDYGMRIRYAGYKTLYLADKGIVMHCKGVVDSIPGNDGDPTYIHFKLSTRKKNTPKLHKNLDAYRDGKKSLKFIRDEKGKVICQPLQ